VTKLQLWPTAHGLLDEVVAWYEDHPAELALPDRRAVVPGAPGVIAWDCEQVTVALANITVGGLNAQSVAMPRAGAPAGVGLPRIATWSVQVVRCTPESGEDATPPSAAELEVAGGRALSDAGLLSECMMSLATLAPGSRVWLPVGSTINAGAVTPLGPEGGFHAVEAAVSISAMEVA
jgi:hypothetical protein